MLSEIKLNAAPVEQDAVGMLLACHQRIRNFTAITLRLGQTDAAAPAEVANAAEAVHRYYTVALPLHEADENQSVYPRLRQVLTAGDAGALELMLKQHGSIDETVARLVPLWNELRNHPEKLAALRPELGKHATRLQELWREHLALEEEIVFPLIRGKLPASALSAIHREMKERRGVTPE